MFGDLPLLLVDGYNVIALDPSYRALFDRDPHAARARLVDHVADYCVGRYRATVVFDAHGNPAADGRPHEIAGVEVIFSAGGADADTVIESLAHEALASGERVTVATSDAVTQWTVGLRVRRMSARSLLQEIREHGRDWEEHVEGDIRSRLEERVDAHTRDVLSRWARGS